MQDGILTTYTFTWDLQKISKGTEMRTEALAAYKAFKTVEGLMAKASRTLEVPPVALSRNQFQAVQLVARYRSPDGPLTADGVTWKRAEQGRWDEGLHLTQDGLLLGVPRCTGQCAIDLVLTYGVEHGPIAVAISVQ